MFIVFLSSIVNASNHTKCFSLRNKNGTFNLLLLIYILINAVDYPFSIKLGRCLGSCNTLNDLSKKISILNKTESLNLSVFNMIAGISESKTLTKHIMRM